MTRALMLSVIAALSLKSASLLAAEKTLGALSASARDLATTSMARMDELWDEPAALCWSPFPDQTRKMHVVRETTWYVVGLLLRNSKGDIDRASRAISAIIDNQFEEPDRPYQGTFARSPEEPPPGADARMWKGYDPNWRQFVGTAFALILQEYESRLPKTLTKRMEEAIRKAVIGEEKHGRLKATYTNISLMHAFLLDYAGARLKEPAWTRRGGELAEAIYGLFKENKAFDEYNSPTYYGVDLYALALWRIWAPSSRLRELGTEMEADLWRDIARFYHAGLRNLAGPFTRSYGMDMPNYVNLTGLWFWEALGRKLAPFPMPDQPTIRTSQDFMWAPCFAILGTNIPPDALPHLKSFQGERRVERVISTSPRFVATAWIGKNVILGAEHTSGQRGAGGGQFHPATVHWKHPEGGVGWIRLYASPPVDARAEKDLIAMSCIGDATFRISGRGLVAKSIGRDLWRLPGLTVQVETDAEAFSVSEGPAYAEIQYRGATKFTLRTTYRP